MMNIAVKIPIHFYKPKIVRRQLICPELYPELCYHFFMCHFKNGTKKEKQQQRQEGKDKQKILTQRNLIASPGE